MNRGGNVVVSGDGVFITGAGSGIGQATARRFGDLGAVVIVTDRDRAAAATTAESIRSSGGQAWEYDLDVTDPERWEVVFSEVVERFGVPRVVVNNAGYTTAGAFLDHSAQDWGRLVAVNVRGVVTGSRMAATYMRDKGIRGQIINVASAAAYTPLTVSSPYCTTMAAVLMFSETLRVELKRYGIGVTAICPGTINAAFYSSAEQLGADTGGAGTRKDLSISVIARLGAGPDTVAAAIVRSVRTDHAVQPVTNEAYLGYVASRVSPTAMRVVARASGTAMIARIEQTGPLGTVLRWLSKSNGATA